jgi:hypothetical protein
VHAYLIEGDPMIVRLVLALIVLAGTPLSGAIVTSGFAEWSWDAGVFDFRAEGPELHASGMLDTYFTPWPGQRCNPCPSGTEVSANAVAAGLDLWGISGGLWFTGPDVRLTAPGTVTSPFDFSGLVCPVWDFDSPACYGRIELTGSGNVEITTVLYPFYNVDDLRIEKARYSFVVPEPSTSLAIVPLLAMIARWHTRRKHARRSL